ncbi:MAG: site-2 protease family protein [Candidatus Portnoybacteria bacterium CG_4_8_14_3_um_filter_44_10]|uniref:Site-2 protease family protein n=6 Tax=Candidatus Portnoyibacteriota TaxID=1817913 RepID=A0A2H0WW76_9BACT|nr:MAG: site-2 protease family protein [Candidatus Portnoybacteria bacterium CG09_land_8_20_14_0_10_44_13]PIW75625.1 MAG: site-2 protease family protein [Candidatus Portnoybacteria bacterium CG_4_8_14_3_um_filter_44_10]PIZ68930.1 MAG: site-2 protease family protein [Candidatus Portnoybacteria bacterium CG_4_10_14_0_2_um_filter_44_20]
MALKPAIFLYIVIIFSAIIHEYAHGLMAYQLGDPTAKYSGRLTLNPLSHIDPFGTVVLPLMLLWMGGFFIGYAKPVPFNPLNFKNEKSGTALVGIAGPASNLLIALILGLFVRFFGNFGFLAAISPLLSFIVLINIWLALFNLLPLPPLDGSKIAIGLVPRSWEGFFFNLERMSFISLFVALALAMTVLPYIVPFIFKLIVGQTAVF